VGRHQFTKASRDVDIIRASRQHVARSVNTAMVQAYWLIGHDIVEVEQHGKARAGYGDELIARLAKHLRPDGSRGWLSWNLSCKPAWTRAGSSCCATASSVAWPFAPQPLDSGKRRRRSTSPATSSSSRVPWVTACQI
jgi:hypothetical protein